MRDTESIIGLTRTAFADVAYPGREALFNDHCCECAEVSGSYGGKPWSETTLEDVLGGRETALLSPAAWRYYLPAVLIWCVREPDAVDVIQDNLVYQLEPPDGERGVPEVQPAGHGVLRGTAIRNRGVPGLVSRARRGVRFRRRGGSAREQRTRVLGSSRDGRSGRRHALLRGGEWQSEQVGSVSGMICVGVRGIVD